MKIDLKYFACIVFQMITSILYAQDLSDCEKDIRKFYTRSEVVKLDKGYYVKYGVQSIYKDKNISSKEVIFTMMYDNYQLQVLSDMLNTYADTISVVSVSRLTKKIVIGNNTKSQFSKMLNSSQLSDSSLWNSFTISSCKTVPNQKEYSREVVLQPKKKNLPLKQISYLYNENASTLYRMSNSYNSSSELQELNYTFYKIDYEYDGSEIKTKNILSLFFDKKGKLLPAYAGYEVIDQRNKK